MFNLITRVLLLKICLASTHKFQNEKISGFPDTLDFESMYSSADYNGKFESEVSYDIQFHGPKSRKAFLVLGRREELNNGMTCVDDELVKIVSDSSVLIQSVVLAGPSPIRLNGEYKIPASGLYSYFIVTCDSDSFYAEEEGHEISVSGFVAFRNPFGYLPAHKYPLYSVYVALIFIYFGLLTYWYTVCLRFRQNLMFYHYCITLLLFFAVLEMLIHTIDIVQYNNSGIRSHIVFLFANVFHITRKLLSRVLIVLICNGVSIMQKAVARKTKKALFAISMLYFGFSLIYEFQKDFKVKGDIDLASYVVSLLISLIDTVFYSWIFFSLYETFSAVPEQDSYKKKLYRNFSIIVGGGCTITVVFLLLELNYIKSKKWLTIFGWKTFWIYEVGFWEFLYMYFVVSIFYVMTPEKNISEYQQIKTDDDLEKQTKSVSQILSEEESLSKGLKFGLDNEEENSSSTEYVSSSKSEEDLDESEEINKSGDGQGLGGEEDVVPNEAVKEDDVVPKEVTKEEDVVPNEAVKEEDVVKMDNRKVSEDADAGSESRPLVGGKASEVARKYEAVPQENANGSKVSRKSKEASPETSELETATGRLELAGGKSIDGREYKEAANAPEKEIAGKIKKGMNMGEPGLSEEEGEEMPAVDEKKERRESEGAADK